MDCLPFVSSPQCCAIQVLGKFSGPRPFVRNCKGSPRLLSPTPSSALKLPSNSLLLFCYGEAHGGFSLHDLIRSTVSCDKGVVVCFAGSDDSSSSSKISSATRIRGEVIAPFRSLRMFFYLAFVGSGSIGALISLPRLFAALGHAPNASPVTDVLTGLGIDLVAVVFFAFLYRSEVKARDLQLARLSREEILASLKVELRNKKVVALGQLRGVARLVLVVGPASHLEEACRASEPYFLKLVERGVAVISFATDGRVPNLKYSSDAASKGESEGASIEVEKLWRGVPIYTTEWTRWLTEQKHLANIPADSPVYLSLRLDGRVRGSGTGLPPWGAFVAQLPPMKGMWSGVLDGLDGKV